MSTLITSTVGHLAATHAITLTPQTTPFAAAQGGACELSVYCWQLTYLNYLSSHQHLSGLQCEALHSSPRDGTPALGYRTECFPEGYLDVFPGLTMEPSMASLAHADPTLAYPGTACVSDWTTACTTTVTGAGGTAYPQAWCCPPGAWTCPAAPRGDGKDPGRRCASVLTEKTEIWMTWDPPFSLPTGDAYTWPAGVSAEPAEYGATVYHDVFPLVLTTSLSAARQQVTGSDDGDDTHAPPPPPAIPDERALPVLSIDAAAGIAVGAVVFVLVAILGGLFFFVRRLKRAKRPVDAGDDTPATSTQHSDGDAVVSDRKPELQGASAVARGTEWIVAPKAELDAARGAERRRQLSELDGARCLPPTRLGP
ncbi:hypothetical protein DL766_009305 [Monosporascus sp. MC13-8B]|uniref:Uncharacterized protein n=1 Tax=Monosporascus cannonballus TaxID=155416 RepID=A0ABY0H9F7_9PEZI|nr:hypothetical protein DL762_003833 [Monosporascus cannonballus]RYO92826.1 hypothetical protein DL763_004551 [Monosporascus cannonballus]RYP15829.1 hypothetical protein DL766_009305 [Monosporascus sp. MC13-8B]